MLSRRKNVGSVVRGGAKVALALLTTIGAATTAHAAGIEDTVGGAIGLGRSAYFARVNDFMATWQNPANLAIIPGGDLGIELRLPILQSCFDRARDGRLLDMGKYKISADDAENEYSESFAKVCNSALPGPTGNIGWAQSFDSGWGWGLGLFTPAGVGNSKYGKDTIVTVNPAEDEQYEPTLSGVEYPTRQLGLERSAITAYVMLGLGWAPVKQFRVGASGGIGFGSVYNKSVVSVLGGTFVDQEIVNELTVSDYAIPRANIAAVVAPFDWLELFAVGTYQGDLSGKGHIELTANGYKGVPIRNCRDKEPGTHCRLEGARLVAPFQTFEATFGMRVAQRREPRERVLDPMKDEIWDFEVDVQWAQTSHVEQFRVKVHDDNPDDAMEEDETVPGIQFTTSEMGGGSPSIPQRRTNIPKFWKDTWTFRAGTDINLVRDRFAIRLGGSYATRAVPLQYMNIDYWPVRKIGVHLGATLKFQERFYATLGYAHLFYEKVSVPLGTGGVKEITNANSEMADAVNEGDYEASLDVFSLQLNARF